MGWPSSEDAAFNQITRLRFTTREEAVAFVELQGLKYTIVEPEQPTFKPKSYSANFKWRGPPKAQ